MDVKDAAQSALSYFGEIYGTKYSNVIVEEVELSEDERFWYITLGYDLPSIIPQFGGTGPRGYKTFKIDAATGKVISMKIRSVLDSAALR
jgi:hypothetical protein